ncbi:MAG: CoA-acylating methylmalonate-semialdehyde dehydrogenase [Acidobacteria bacterium]|nr:CoA-acylating methylmalonate-semialdehyde dehydrogenase [Acidobacteriota bacterium]
MKTERELLNYIHGQWRPSSADQYLNVTNPATGQILARVPLSPAAEVDEAARHAAAAFEVWRRTPPTERVQYLFRLKNLLEENSLDLARIITSECGKTVAESLGELRRAIENVEMACGIPSLMQGTNVEDVAGGIDEHLFRQPVGVVAAITPFNFPGMVPLWFLPCAIACGNCFILKPSEKVPLTVVRLFELMEQTGLPPGVVQLVHGEKETVNAILDHPVIRAISFVGSTPVARYVYARATAAGKRAQCQGGARNPVIVMPDADLDVTAKIVAESAFGCAGQRCLASSTALIVGEARRSFTEAITHGAAALRVGNGMEEGVQMGPVITAQSKARIESLIALGRQEGARVLVDGSGKSVERHPNGCFVFPTVLDSVDPRSEIARTEVFGPVLSLMYVATIDDAIAEVNRAPYGNMACLFTGSGSAARNFRYRANAGNIGINVGVAAPMAFFPFSGWKESFFGDLHAQGRHAVEFYTETKVVVERWP